MDAAEDAAVEDAAAADRAEEAEAHLDELLYDLFVKGNNGQGINASDQGRLLHLLDACREVCVHACTAAACTADACIHETDPFPCMLPQTGCYPTLRKIQDVSAYGKAHGNPAGWTEHVLTVGPEDFPANTPGIPHDMRTYTATFHFCDIMRELKRHYSQSPSGKFAVAFEKKVDGQGRRCYNEPHQCDKWKGLEQDLRQSHSEGVLAALQRMENGGLEPSRCTGSRTLPASSAS